MHIVNVLNQAVCLFVTLLIVLSLWSSVTGKRSHLVTQTHRIVNTAKTKAEWHAAALASDFKTLPIQNFEGDDRDEYGHLTFAAYCDALETRGKDPEWPSALLTTPPTASTASASRAPRSSAPP